MITIHWLYDLDPKELGNTYSLVEYLRDYIGVEMPTEFKDTHFMKMFNKLNQGITIHLALNPYEVDVHERKVLIWSSNRQALRERYNTLADDI